MAIRDRTREIAAFLNDLSLYCGHSAVAATDPVHLRARIAAYVPVLLEHFPTVPFAKGLLLFASKRHKFWPAMPDLIETIETWWTENQPRTFSPPRDLLDDGSLSAEDKAGIIAWMRARDAGFMHSDGSSGERNGLLRLGVLRRTMPRAFAWLARNDDGVALIVVRKGWSRDVEPASPPATVDAVRWGDGPLLVGEIIQHEDGIRPDPSTWSPPTI